MLEASQISWTSDAPPILGSYTAKTRYRQVDAPCALTLNHSEQFALKFDEAQWAVTPGQSAVLYDDQRCLGGGIITA